MAQSPPTFRDKKFISLFNVFEHQNNKLTLKLFKEPSKWLANHLKWAPGILANIDRAKDIFWEEMNFPNPNEVTEEEWVAAWNALVAQTFGDKAPDWATNITLFVFQAMNTKGTGRIYSDGKICA